MSKRLNPITDTGEVVRVIAAEQAPPRNGAHLVVQLRPADPAAAVAEPDELDRVRIRRSRGGATWDPSMACLPPGRTTRGDAARRSSAK